MEVDAQAGSSAPAKMSLALVALVRTAQGQNGVKHGDFSRYMRHCRNKLQSLYKALKLQHGRTKFVKRKIEPTHIQTDIRYLHVPIFSAERALAVAMEYKKKIENEMDLKIRRHMIARFRKAAVWGREVARLAAACCDTATILEAQAYAAYLSATELVERSTGGGEGSQIDRATQRKRALALLTRSRHILTSLAGHVGVPPDTQALYLQQVEDMEPAIRYCKYEISKKGAAPADKELLALAEQEDSSLPGLQLDAALAAFAQESRAAAATSTTSTAGAATAAKDAPAGTVVYVEWLGQKLAVKQAQLQAAVSQVNALDTELCSAMDTEGAPGGSARGAVCEKLVKALSTALGAAQHAVKRAAVSQEGSAAQEIGELERIENALAGLLAARQSDLAELQTQEVEAKFARGLERAGAQASGSKKGGKDKERRGEGGARAEEVVRALDTQLRALMALADIGARGAGRAGEDLYAYTTAKADAVRAARIYYTCHGLLAAGRALDAYALFGRAEQRLQEAVDGGPDPDTTARLKHLLAQAGLYKSVAQAEVSAQLAASREGVQTGIDKLGLAEGKGQGAEGSRWLLDSLDTWESFAGTAKGTQARVYNLPFPMQAIPCRPIMLDTAATYVAYPSVEHRVPKVEKKGVLSSLWGMSGWGARK